MCSAHNAGMRKNLLAILSLGMCLCLFEVKVGAASNVFVVVEASSAVENAGEGFAVEDSGEVRISPRRDCEWSITGPQDLRYNCLAWSVGLTNVWVSDVLTNKQGGAYEEYLVNHGDFMVWMISIVL